MLAHRAAALESTGRPRRSGASKSWSDADSSFFHGRAVDACLDVEFADGRAAVSVSCFDSTLTWKRADHCVSDAPHGESTWTAFDADFGSVHVYGERICRSADGKTGYFC
mmetsp:Transcript_56426/g.134753  ORF Transcript_56426/g.134753 Transcript_56426/m.134753 type:complete len:110 (+) Transcript_56426:460-789(+)